MLWLLFTTATADTLDVGTLSADTAIYIQMNAGEVLNYHVSSIVYCYDEDGNPFGDSIFLLNNITASTDTLVTCFLTGDEEAPVGEKEPWYFSVIDLNTRPFSYPTGRVFSYEWIISSEDADFSHSFYVPTPINSAPEDILDTSSSSIMMKAQVTGLRGEAIHLSANTTGLTDLHVQSGAPTGDPTDRLPMYLSAPEDARSATTPAAVSDWSLSYTSTLEGCEGIIPGAAPVQLSFSSPLRGLAAFGCDIDQDNTLDPSGLYGDVVGGFSTDSTGSSWTWYGEDADGSGYVAPGEYLCAGGVFVGAMHTMVKNADVADPGVRMFTIESDYTAAGVTLYWNDLLLRDEVPLASGETALLQSGPDITAGKFTDTQTASLNSHGWGNTDEPLSRGSLGWIDTWTHGEFFEHGQGTVLVLDKDSDDDGDGLPLATECDIGTLPGSSDTDGDGIDDGQEIIDGTDPTDNSDYKEVGDTGSGDTDTDTGTSPDSVFDIALGNLSGGALACTTAAPLGRRALAPLFAIALAAALVRRRR